MPAFFGISEIDFALVDRDCGPVTLFEHEAVALCRRKDRSRRWDGYFQTCQTVCQHPRHGHAPQEISIGWHWSDQQSEPSANLSRARTADAARTPSLDWEASTSLGLDFFPRSVRSFVYAWTNLQNNLVNMNPEIQITLVQDFGGNQTRTQQGQPTKWRNANLTARFAYRPNANNQNELGWSPSKPTSPLPLSASRSPVDSQVPNKREEKKL